jgi:hypothetical protein
MWSGPVLGKTNVLRACYEELMTIRFTLIKVKGAYRTFSRSKPGTVPLAELKNLTTLYVAGQPVVFKNPSVRDCNLDLVYNVAGVNGFIFGVSYLQPRCAAQKSSIQGPSGTFV